jgi:hypothetical protein
MNAAAAVPFVIGQWVCGSRFYGRQAEITGLLGARHRRLWIAGLRRIGKTSLLKQLDHLSAADARSVPLFWDLQGVGSAEELGLTFIDALLDAEETLARQGIPLEEIEDRDLFAAMEKLARALQDRGTEMLLLCDEADELMALERNAPGLLARLWQAIDVFVAARVVLASSLRLCDFGGVEIERFEAPRYLGVLTDGEARSLLRQDRLPAGSRPSFDEACVETIREPCGNHPMLLQIVAKRCQETGDAGEALRQVAADRSVQHLLSVDFDLLASAEQRLLRSVAVSDSGCDAEPAAVERLLRLGLIRHGGPCGLTIPNRFLAAWLRGS